MIVDTDDIKARLGRLQDHLAQFRAELRTVDDEVRRFELLCDNMFSVFVGPSLRSDGDAPISNLDTGDPIPEPFPPFLSALRTELEIPQRDAHHYSGPEALPELASAATQFLTRNFRARRPEELEVLPCVGLVHAYDALCRVLVQVDGDTVLLPSLGYGFFTTQPHRAGGRSAVAECDARGAVTASDLEASIVRENRRLWSEWCIDSDALFSRGVRRLEASRVLSRRSLQPGTCASVLELLRSKPGMAASVELARMLSDADPALAKESLRSKAIALIRPPRVVAYLHIQPSVSGHVYGEHETLALAGVLKIHDVAPIEDVAYHSIRCDLRDLPMLLDTGSKPFLLLGLSKPLAIANFRLGLLYCPKGRSARLRRALESSAGYVSTLLQRALASALVDDGYESYVSNLSYRPDGYSSREQVMHSALVGQQGRQENHTLMAQLVERAVASEPQLNGHASRFRDLGMTQWFTPVVRSTAGFFQAVSCSRLFERPAFKELGIQTSFDAFALLAYLFDFRSIPEEAMRPGPDPGSILRLSFSPDPAFIVHRFLRAFAGISELENRY